MNAGSLYRMGHWCYQRRIPLVPTLIKFDIGARTIAGASRGQALEVEA